MPGPHGFAVRNNVVRPARGLLAHEFSKEPPCDHLARRRCRVHRILSRVRDDRQRPSCRERTGRAGSADLPDGLSEIFLRGGTGRPDSPWNHCEKSPLAKIAFWLSSCPGLPRASTSLLWLGTKHVDG